MTFLFFIFQFFISLAAASPPEMIELHQGWEVFYTNESISEDTHNVSKLLSNATWKPIVSPNLYGKDIGADFVWFKLRMPLREGTNQKEKMSLFISGFGYPFSVISKGKVIYQFKTVNREHPFFYFPWHLIPLPEGLSEYVYIYTSLPKVNGPTGFETPIYLIETSNAYFQIAKLHFRQGCIGFFTLFLALTGFLISIYLRNFRVILPFSLTCLSLSALLIAAPSGPTVKQLMLDDPIFWGVLYESSRFFLPIFLMHFYINIFSKKNCLLYWILSRPLLIISYLWLIPMVLAFTGKLTFPAMLPVYFWFSILWRSFTAIDCISRYKESNPNQKVFCFGYTLFVSFGIYSVLCGNGLLPNKWAQPGVDLSSLCLVLTILITTLMKIIEIQLGNFLLSEELRIVHLLVHDSSAMIKRLKFQVDRMIAFSIGSLNEEFVTAHMQPVRRWIEIMNARNTTALNQDLRGQSTEKPFRLSDAIKESIERCFLFQDSNQIEFEYNFSHNYMVANNRLALDSVLDNLIGNAQKALMQAGSKSKGKKISFHSRVEIKKDGPHICLSITNTHSFIPPEVLNKLFIEPIHSLSGGHGCGLYLTKYNLENKLRGKMLKPVSNKDEQTVQLSIQFPTDSSVLESDEC